MSSIALALPLEAVVLSVLVDLSNNSSFETCCEDACVGCRESACVECSDGSAVCTPQPYCLDLWRELKRLKGRPRWRERGCHEIRQVPNYHKESIVTRV
jgi:hypothetical protein